MQWLNYTKVDGFIVPSFVVTLASTHSPIARYQ